MEKKLRRSNRNSFSWPIKVQADCLGMEQWKGTQAGPVLRTTSVPAKSSLIINNHDRTQLSLLCKISMCVCVFFFKYSDMWILLCANSQKNLEAKNWEAQKKPKETHLIFSGKGELRCFLLSCLHLTCFQVCSRGGRLNLEAFVVTQCRAIWWYQKACI